MKTRKTELRIFTIADWEKEERYLQKRHREGWKFRRVNLLGIYHFERCTPEDVVYQLDYNEEGLKHKDEYVQMFQDCGWEYMQDFGGYSYFRKPVSEMQGEEKIFCDDESRLDMMRRVFGRPVSADPYYSCIADPAQSVRTVPQPGCRRPRPAGAVSDSSGGLCLGGRVFRLSLLEIKRPAEKMMPGLISAESIGRDCRTGRGPVAGFLSDCPAAAVSSKNAMRIGPPKKRLCILGRPILVRDFF